MKHILLGILLVVMAAVVVNKKMWKHRTFLLILMGILVVIMAVSLFFSEKEMFQTTATECTSTSIVYTGSGNFTINDWDLAMSSNKDTVQQTSNSALTPYGQSIHDIKGGNNLYCAANRSRFVNVLTNKQCWDRLTEYLIFHMATDTMILPYMYETDNAQIGMYSLDTNSLDRYQNFKDLLPANPSLAGADTNGVFEPQYVELQRLSTDTGQQSFLNLSLFHHIVCFYVLRANSTDNERLFYLSIWLEKAVFANLSKFNTSPVQRQNIVRLLCGLTTRYLGYDKMVIIRDSELQIYKCDHIVHAKNMISALFRTEMGNINNKYGLVFHSAAAISAVGSTGLPTVNPINDTIKIFTMALLSAYLLKMFVSDININDTIGLTINDSFINFTLNIGSLLNNEIKSLLEKTLKHVACHEYIVNAATAKGLTSTQLDILLRNYMSDDSKCIKPMNTDSIVNVINTTSYSTSELNNTIVPTLITATTTQSERSALFDIGRSVRRILFKSVLDTGNTQSAKYPDYDKLPIGFTHVGFINTFNYIFNNGSVDATINNGTTNIAVKNFFDQYRLENGDVRTSTDYANRQVRLLEIDLSTLTNAINTVKANYENYYTALE